MRVSESIHLKLARALEPVEVEVVDESHLHAGHAGAPQSTRDSEGGESHFRIKVVAAAFEGHSRVARQRMINDILKEELSGPVHALTMKTLTPGEAALDGD